MGEWSLISRAIIYLHILINLSILLEGYNIVGNFAVKRSLVWFRIVDPALM